MGAGQQFDEWIRTSLRYLVLSNAGGVAATLAFIGAALGQSPHWKAAVIPLTVFVVGLVVASVAILGQLTSTWVTWVQHDIPGSAPEQSSFVTRLGMWAEAKTGRIMFVSFLCFIFGSFLGIGVLVRA